MIGVRTPYLRPQRMFQQSLRGMNCVYIFKWIVQNASLSFSFLWCIVHSSTLSFLKQCLCYVIFRSFVSLFFILWRPLLNLSTLFSHLWRLSILTTQKGNWTSLHQHLIILHQSTDFFNNGQIHSFRVGIVLCRVRYPLSQKCTMAGEMANLYLKVQNGFLSTCEYISIFCSSFSNRFPLNRHQIGFPVSL